MLGLSQRRIGALHLAVFAAVLLAMSLAASGYAHAQWTLTKTAFPPVPTGYTAAGQTINYSYVVTNTSASDFFGIDVTDNLTTVTCPQTELTPGESMTCTASYVTTAADLLVDSITNIATATGSFSNEDPLPTLTASATVNNVSQPFWTLTKTPSPTTYTAAGETIAYSYVLTNTGGVTISSISLTDDKIAGISCPSTSLAAGASMTCTGSYLTTAIDVINRSIDNTATATGTPATGTLAPATAQATVTLLARPAWTLTKAPNPSTYTAAGQTINYSYLLTNTGNVSISAIAISDNKIATVSCPATTLDIGANMTCTGSYVTTAADVTAGSVANIATATGTPGAGTLADATANATITFTPQPSWTLTKTPTPTSYTAAGQTINYSFLLTNTGNVSISAIAISDNKIASVSCPATTLAPGANMTCTGSYITTAADVSAGSITNTATATGTPASGALNPATAQATVTFNAQPSWTLTKTPSPTTYSGAATTINYSFLLTNTGNVSISAIAISDNKIASVSCPATTLAPGASMTCTGSYITTAADVSAGSVTNTATATGTPAGGTLAPVTASATVTFVAPPTGSITIIKTASGGNATFNFTANVAGATSFTLTTGGGTASRNFSSLTPGTYTFSEVNLPLHWNLTALTCTGESGGTPTTVNLASRTVSIGLDGGETITCTFANTFDDARHIRETQTEIQRFLSHRLTLLANHEPDRARFIRRFGGSLWGEPGPPGFVGPAASNDGPFSFAGSSNPLSTQFAFATSLSRIKQASIDIAERDQRAGPSALAFAGKAPPRRWMQQNGVDLWIEAHYSEYRAKPAGGIGSKGNFGIVYVGADYLVTQSVLLGALVQFDWIGETTGTSGVSASGHGWMAGPYLSIRLLPNLFFDARAAWGQSDNKINPFGLYEDAFATNRWLANARLTGNWRRGDFRITPSVWFTYITENQQSYTDSLGVVIPSQTATLGRLSFGPEFAYRIFGSGGVIYEPHISIAGQWDIIKPNVASVAGLPVASDNLHARVQAGLLARSPSGLNLRAVASYDGLGSSSLNDYGVRVWLNLPLRSDTTARSGGRPRRQGSP